MLRHRPRGSATTEVALILTLLACGLLITYSQLGGQAQKVFARLTVDGLPSSTAISSTSLGPDNGPRIFRAIDQEADDIPITGVFLAFGAAVVFLGVGGVLAIRKRRRVILDDQPPTETVVKVSELPEALFDKRQDLLHLFEKTIAHGSGSTPSVELVMSNRLSFALPKTPVDELRLRMKKERLRHLLVCDGQGKLVGMVSDRDLVRPGTTAAEIMTKSPLTVAGKTPLISAVTILINRRFSALPVAEDGKPIGIITTTDIMLAMQASVMLLQKKSK
jgi:CBS domain-containing protein